MRWIRACGRNIIWDWSVGLIKLIVSLSLYRRLVCFLSKCGELETVCSRTTFPLGITGRRKPSTPTHNNQAFLGLPIPFKV